MHTIDKIIDKKSVSFWLDDCFVRASVNRRIIGDVAAAVYLPGSAETHWTRGRDWQEFARLTLAPMPSAAQSDARWITDELFQIVISAATQLRKEAA
jgi:hypothetical protein